MVIVIEIFSMMMEKNVFMLIIRLAIKEKMCPLSSLLLILVMIGLPITLMEYLK